MGLKASKVKGAKLRIDSAALAGRTADLPEPERTARKLGSKIGGLASELPLDGLDVCCLSSGQSAAWTESLLKPVSPLNQRSRERRSETRYVEKARFRHVCCRSDSVALQNRESARADARNGVPAQKLALKKRL